MLATLGQQINLCPAKVSVRLLSRPPVGSLRREVRREVDTGVLKTLLKCPSQQLYSRLLLPEQPPVADGELLDHGLATLQVVPPAPRSGETPVLAVLAPQCCRDNQSEGDNFEVNPVEDPSGFSIPLTRIDRPLPLPLESVQGVFSAVSGGDENVRSEASSVLSSGPFQLHHRFSGIV
ncbi:hypothetical protein DPEC_G00298220 [Dallia pectoralis]|uniref:Uncharacterized protein n=1 Tax=Dallia pectoralis TaxID=75939 RepID=A0ACC2FFS7_DALPE|nr:hypothetical protein DPEC_G00298220 [Dallia pectoralis]